MTFDTIIASLENEILTVTINRPDKLNALNKQVFSDLESVVDYIEKTPGIKSAVITGAGTKAFVAGADIAEFAQYSKEQAKELAQRGQDIFLKIENCSKPVIAAVNGFALGGGCELAMACHFRIASQDAKFGQPEVNLGLIPGYGGTQRLTQIVGKGRAMEMLMTGKNIDANTALEFGLINHVTFPEDLMAKAYEILGTINSKAPRAIAACIKTANLSASSHDGFAEEVSAFAECFATKDMKEGVTAFLEKRKAKFTGE